ncbi:helix-turn-helix transcriptional regulator [Brachybacterium epidermidis]|uniref:helix-turn-helix transcriptional regulator n=1 Tax=Brachybacterium epidermidis TaxID=2781983 RepID=UPI00398E7268
MTTDQQAAMDRPPPTHRVAAAQQPGATGPLDGPALASVLELARSAAPTLTATDLADQAGYSPFHFSRLFTARLGIGPGQYLTALRIDAAKRLLLSDSDPVVDVATAVGFDFLSSFSRRFRETVGVPRASCAASPIGWPTVSPHPSRCPVRMRGPSGCTWTCRQRW